MIDQVIDSSAILAILREERRASNAFDLAYSGTMSAVIYSEIVSKCGMKGPDMNKAIGLIKALEINIEPLGADTAHQAGALKLNKCFWPLSLADCICIALAIEKSATLVTADHAWLELNLPCPVEVIR